MPEPSSDRRAIYFRLGELYDERLPNPERAELAYQEILKHSPSDALGRARERLVALYQKMGDPARAIEQQTLLVNAAETPEAKCAAHDRSSPPSTRPSATRRRPRRRCLQARKTWPKDDVALGALARFYLRSNQAQAANVLLDRAVADARRALGTGRFEPYLFSTIATVAELRNRPDAARVAKAAVASLEGGDAALDGRGRRPPPTPSLDDLLAPDVHHAGVPRSAPEDGAAARHRGALRLCGGPRRAAAAAARRSRRPDPRASPPATACPGCRSTSPPCSAPCACR